MISLTRPSADAVSRFRARVGELAVNYPADGHFHELQREGVVGHGPGALAAGATALVGWHMHAGAGIEATPVPIALGETVTMLTRRFGLWLLFACRITEIHDSDGQFGFTYTTLPGHPVQGIESFVLHEQDNGDVVLRVSARSRAASPLTRALGPIGRQLQRRYMSTYIDAVSRSDSSPGP